MLPAVEAESKHNMNKGFSNKVNPVGEVYRQAYSGDIMKKLLEKELGLNFDASYVRYVNGKGVIDFNVLCAMAFDAGISKEDFKRIRDKSIKKQFADNYLWRFFKKNFNKDIAIPFITGHYTTKALKGNLVTNAGHAGYSGQISGVTSTAFTAMAYGTGTTAAAATDTALQTEISRAAATITQQTTSTTNDTAQWVHTFTAGGSQAVTEEGILDNNSSGGHLLAHQVFSAVNMVLNDTIQFTHKIQS
jgi:hypothetical protein